MLTLKNDQAILELLKENRLFINNATGQVYSKKSNTPNKPLGAITQKGYLRTCINYKGIQYYLMIHRIVWIALYGITLKGARIDHINMVKTDNKPKNLQAISNSENTRRAKLKGAYINCGRKTGAPRDIKGRFIKAAGRVLDDKIWDEFPKLVGGLK